jgi:hypothetical protein
MPLLVRIVAVLILLTAMATTKVLSAYALSFAASTTFVAFGSTISAPTDSTFAFIWERSNVAIGQTFRVPDPVSENLLASVTLNLREGPFDDDEDPVTFGYEVEVFAFDSTAFETIGPALYTSGPQVWIAEPNLPVFNPVTFDGLNLTVSSTATYILIFRPANDLDSFTIGTIHQNLSDPYQDGGRFYFSDNMWFGDDATDLSFDAVFVSASAPEPASLILTGFALLGTITASRLRHALSTRRR